MPAMLTPSAPTDTQAQPAGPIVPFPRASQRYREPFIDQQSQLSGTTQQLVFADVPAHGYLRHVTLLVTATAGAAGMASVAAAADAPWSVLSEVTLQDVNGTNIVGPVTGYQLYLINKWGAYRRLNPTDSPSYSAVDTDGDFSFLLTIPVEFVQRDALGSLPNQNASATYKVRVGLAASTSVYTTPPDTLPTVRVQGWAHDWAPPAQADAGGQLQQTQPEAVGTVAYWSVFVTDVVSGENTIRLPRVGNMIRNLVLVYRQSGARDSSDLPPSWRWEWDARTLFNEGDALTEESMVMAYGFDPDTGVRVWTMTDDFDAKAGDELRDYYWRTTQATRLEVRANFGDAGTLEILTNDVMPQGQIFTNAQL